MTTAHERIDVTMTCSECGGENISARAHTHWDARSQSWAALDIDDGYCEDCKYDSVDIIAVPIAERRVLSIDQVQQRARQWLREMSVDESVEIDDDATVTHVPETDPDHPGFAWVQAWVLVPDVDGVEGLEEAVAREAASAAQSAIRSAVAGIPTTGDDRRDTRRARGRMLHDLRRATEDCGDAESAIVDAMVDLLHYAEALRLDPFAILRMVQGHATEELRSQGGGA